MFGSSELVSNVISLMQFGHWIWYPGFNRCARSLNGVRQWEQIIFIRSVIEALLPRPSGYLRDVLIDVNLVLRLVPKPFTTAMIASEMPAAIRPYSMAVAPVSSAINLRNVFMPRRYREKTKAR
jgi:hypothetical protein